MVSRTMKKRRAAADDGDHPELETEVTNRTTATSSSDAAERTAITTRSTREETVDLAGDVVGVEESDDGDDNGDESDSNEEDNNETGENEEAVSHKAVDNKISGENNDGDEEEEEEEEDNENDSDENENCDYGAKHTDTGRKEPFTKKNNRTLVYKSDKKTSNPSLSHSKEIGNGLTALIPGYTAPMKLDTSGTSLDKHRCSLSQLRKQAQRNDTTVERKRRLQQTNFVPSTFASYSFKLGPKKLPDLSAGSGWFGMKPSEMTPELKTDLRVIRNRSYLNPKKFYKSSDAFARGSALVQVGTVVEGAAEYYSSRLTKRERRNNVTEEMMADADTVNYYAKHKARRMQREREQVQQRQARFQGRSKKNRRARRGY